MGTLYFIIFLVVINTPIAFTCEYIKFGPDHTMCAYTKQGCTVTARKYSSTDAEELVKLHNEKRQFIASGKQKGQPTAADMNKLSWNEELAVIAQRWADQCTFAHDNNRQSKTYVRVGQNIFISSSNKANSNLNLKEAVDAWYDEVVKPGFNSKDLNPFRISPGNGHYTQLVWGNSKEVGCGYTFYSKNNLHHKLIVCDYGPSGNKLNGEMYKVGNPCSACTSGCSGSFNALCK